MTLDEFDQFLGKRGFVVDDETSRRWFMVWDQQHRLVGKVSKEQRYVFSINYQVSLSMLTKSFWHFASTPLHERNADCSVTVELSDQDLNALANLTTLQITDHASLWINDDELHALRHLRRQLQMNPQLYKKD